MESRWPCQRLRLGFGALIFFVFEILIGRQLPMPLTGALMGVGIVCLISAHAALRTFKLEYQVALIHDAINQRNRRF